MIQSIQTVYLLLTSIVSVGIIFVFNLWKSTDKSIFALDLLNSDVSLFKNRKLQFVIGRLTILINLILLGLLIYVSLTLPGEAAVSEKGIGMFVPILAVLLLVLANKAIKKDEDLVKSVDRLR